MDITQERLSQVINDSGLSHREIENLTGISRTTIYRYANKKVKKIPLEAVKQIAKATHTNAAYIMGWDEKPESRIKQELHDYIDRIDDEKLEKAFMILKTLNEEL